MTRYAQRVLSAVLPPKIGPLLWRSTERQRLIDKAERTPQDRWISSTSSTAGQPSRGAAGVGSNPARTTTMPVAVSEHYEHGGTMLRVRVRVRSIVPCAWHSPPTPTPTLTTLTTPTLTR